MADEAEKPQTYVERMEVATRSMHASMQWVVAAFAAVGAVAFAGLQLSDLGALDPAESPARFVAAIVGVTLVFGGVAAAIGLAGLFFRREPLTIPVLIENGGSVLARIDGDSTILGTYCTVQGLKNDYDAAVRVLQTENASDTEKSNAAQEADRTLDVMRNVAARGNAMATSSRYKRTLLQMSIAVIAAVVGGALFAWGANPPKEVTAELPTVVRPLTPVAIRITTVEQARLDEIRALLGTECDLGSLSGVALEQHSSDAFRIAIEGGDGCRAEVIDVTGDDGQVTTETETVETTVYVPDPPDG